MENIIKVVSHEGKNYFSIKSTGGLEFFVTFLRIKYFAGRKKWEFYHIEGWRNGGVILNGYVSHYTGNCFVATFDHSDISSLHTERPYDEFREFEVLAAEPFSEGDILCTAIKGGVLIANDLHLALQRTLATPSSRMGQEETLMPKPHADEQLRYYEIHKHRVLIPGLY